MGGVRYGWSESDMGGMRYGWTWSESDMSGVSGSGVSERGVGGVSKRGVGGVGEKEYSGRYQWSRRSVLVWSSPSGPPYV